MLEFYFNVHSFQKDHHKRHGSKGKGSHKSHGEVKGKSHGSHGVDLTSVADAASKVDTNLNADVGM